MRVLDRGPGVPASETCARSSSRSTAPTRAATSADGQGIGLAITARVMELHGGTVEAPTAGRGLEVVLRLPMKEKTT